MTLKEQNELRKCFVDRLMSALSDEDLGMITSNSFNFPTVTSEGTDAWVEIVVKVPKEDDGYDKREEYKLKLVEKEQKAKEAEAKKARKIAEDKAKRAEREAKRKAKEE